MRSEASLRAGEWVEVRSRGEILRTLDGNACLESMPFMPEMLRFCGQRFRVFKRIAGYEIFVFRFPQDGFQRIENMVFRLIRELKIHEPILDHRAREGIELHPAESRDDVIVDHRLPSLCP